MVIEDVKPMAERPLNRILRTLRTKLKKIDEKKKLGKTHGAAPMKIDS